MCIRDRGKYCGEGYLRELKPVAQCTSHKNRESNLLRKLLHQKSVASIMNDEDTRLKAENIPPVTNRKRIYRMAHRYASIFLGMEHFLCAKPISIIVYCYAQSSAVKHYGFFFQRGRRIFIAELKRHVKETILVGGCLLYWSFSLPDIECESRNLEDVVVDDYGLLLPLNYQPQNATRDELDEGYYTLITQGWSTESMSL